MAQFTHPNFIGPETAELLQKGNLLYEQGKLEQAERLTDQLCDIEEMARRSAAENDMAAFDFTPDGKSGMEVYTLYLDWCQRNAANLYNYIGVKYLDRNSISQAIRCYEKSIANAKQSNGILENHDCDHLLIIAYWMLGSIHHAQKQSRKAAEYLEQCIACTPTVKDQKLQAALNCQSEAKKLLAEIGKPAKSSTPPQKKGWLGKLLGG